MVSRIDRLNEDLARDLGVRLETRIGLATGEVVTGASFPTGPAVNLAARLRQVASVGQIVVADLTRRLVLHAARLEPLADVELPGKPTAAFRLLDVTTEAPPLARRLDAPFVGRTRELEQLGDAFAGVVRDGMTRAVALVGPAGIGKSRLAHELRASLGEDVTLLTGRCLPYGQGITFWPLRTIVRQATGDASHDAIVTALSDADEGTAAAKTLWAALDSKAPPAEEVAWAFRLFCEEIARRGPLVLVLDDLQWAESALLAVVESLGDRAHGAPILVLCLAREELLEDGPGFLRRQEGADTLVLEALQEEDSHALAEALCAEAGLSAETRRRVVDGAEGNPLFLEQLVALAAEEGGDAGQQPLPATIQALLLARLDRLGPGERAVLERAAVVGRDFAREAVAELVEPAVVPTIRRHLDALARRGFVRRTASTSTFDEAFRFRHALIQTAAYGATSKALRAHLHERHARWLDARSGPETATRHALVGYHVEQAYVHRTELGQVDDRTRSLAAEAGVRLGIAGIRTWKGGDARGSVNVLGRAASLMSVADPRRGELLCELGVALGTAGESRRAQEVLQEALEISLGASDRRIELRARLELAYLSLLDRPLEGPDELLDVVSTAIPALDEIGDDRALGRAWLLAGFVHGGIRCRHADWLENAERALVHHERGGWPTAGCVGQIAAALYYGPTPVATAIARFAELHSDIAADRVAEAHIHVFRGGLEAQRGAFDEACELVRLAREVYDDLGYARLSATHCGTVTADIAFLTGDPDAAEDVLRATCETLLEMRDLSNLATHAADLAEALYVQGRYDEAEAWTRTSETHASRDDLTAEPSWRSVRAKVLARRGDAAEAENLAREAVRLAAKTDALNERARVELDLAETLRIAGRGGEAAAHVMQAVDLYVLKGNTAAGGRARRLLAETPTA
jgi:tetratricopeptide (TPR) repeat protein